MRGDIPRDDGTRADNSIVADRDIGADDNAAAEPHVIPYCDGPSTFDAGRPRVVILHGVKRGEQLAAWPDLNVIAQRDGGGVKKYGVKVDEAPVADGDVEAVIAPKRVLDKGLSEAFEQVAVEAVALRDVEQALVIYFGEFAQTVEVGLDEFRVAGIIILPGDHLFAVGCHGLSPRRCAWICFVGAGFRVAVSALVEASVAGYIAQHCRSVMGAWGIQG